MIGIVGLGFNMKEQAKYEKEQLKYSPETKYQVVKEAMLQPITPKHEKYPELSVPEHISLLRELVFSNNPQLCLIEGAQGRSCFFSYPTCDLLIVRFRNWQNDTRTETAQRAYYQRSCSLLLLVTQRPREES